MKDFFVNNWLALIGALAWIPVLINILLNNLRRIHVVYLDKHFVYNVTFNSNVNGRSTVKTGMCFLIALNLFVYNYPFFPKRIKCNLTLKNGSKHSAELYEGGIAYSDTEDPPNNHIFLFPEQLNMNIDRAIFENTNNIRILPFFFENLNMENDENIEEIELFFYGRTFKKRVTIRNDDCTRFKFISQFDKIIKS